MPDADLSSAVPPQATWVKIHYEIRSSAPGAPLIARLWSGSKEEAVTVNGPEGAVFVRLLQPQRLSYESPRSVELKLKIVSYKIP
jgi:hypothetical protein